MNDLFSDKQSQISSIQSLASGTAQGPAKGMVQTAGLGYPQFQTPFDAAILWREYAGYLETKLSRLGGDHNHIANDVIRTYPPKRVERTTYE